MTAPGAPPLASFEQNLPPSRLQILELRDISRFFQVRRGFFGKKQRLQAVADLSLSLAAGETLGLVGESGCGKSTVAKIAAGLLAPDAGEVLLDGALLQTGRTVARKLLTPVQMVFQDPFSSLNPRLTIGASIREPLDIAGALPRSARDEQVAEMLRLVGLLPEHARRYPHEFSGGQRQRVVVARALISRPKLVICDEPVSSLDASVQAQVLNLLKSLQARFSPAYLFISHDLSVVGHMSDRIAVMYLGRIVELAAAQDLFDSPRHPYTQALLAAIPGASKEGLGILKGEPASPLEPPPGCAFHPRCPHAMPICREQRPALILRQGRIAACWLYSESEKQMRTIIKKTRI